MIIQFKKYVPGIGLAIIWGIFFFMTFFSQSLKAEKKLLPFKDISQDWMVYDEKAEIFVPYLPSFHLNHVSKSLIIQRNQYLNSYLSLKNKISYELFVNGIYYKDFPPLNYSQEEPNLISLNQLKREFPGKQLVLTFFSEELSGIPENIQLVQYREVVNIKQNLKRTSNYLNYTMIAGLFGILLYLVFLRVNFPTNFKAYFSLRDWFSLSNRHLLVYNSAFDFPNLSILIILSILFGFISVNNQYHLSLNYISAQQINQNFQVGGMLWLVFKATGIGFFLFVTRWPVYFVVARVLNIRRITNFHYFKNLQTNFQFYFISFIVFILLSIYHGNNTQMNIDLYLYCVNGFYLVRAIYYYFLFRKNLEINVLTTLAYLLLTEGQIALFGVRIILFNDLQA